MRSEIVGAFPNLEITALPSVGSTDAQSEVCILSVIAKDTLLCVFDRAAAANGRPEGFVMFPAAAPTVLCRGN